MSRAGPTAGDLVERVRWRLVADGAAPSPQLVARAVRREAGPLGEGEIRAAVQAAWAETAGAGPLEPLLADPAVTDVCVNGPDEVWIDAGDGLRRVPLALGGEPAVRRLAQRLAAACGRRLDDACPFVDARLPDGVRVHAVLPPISGAGTLLSLRVPPRRTFTLDALIAAGGLPSAGAALLRAVVRARVAFLVSGGTGSGKTTLLSTLLSEVSPAERLVLVEDCAELRPEHPHVVRLQARLPNVEGNGAVPLGALVRQALRMRPDRLVVGEVRGEEVRDLLNALNTGHDGGCGTVHANRVADVPARLEALAVGAGLAREALHSQLAAAVGVLVHLARDGDGRRRLAEVGVLERAGSGLVTALVAVTFPRDGAAVSGPGVRRLQELLAAGGQGWAG